jgi:dinuclear metal center YbgI/SA1388 family protein
VADLGDLLDARYPPATAEDWDAVGLTVGDPSAVVRRVLFAVDPVEAVVAEAEAVGADLLVTHHPLLLRGVHAVAATTAKGRVVHRLIRSGIALYSAHTNADVASPGVSDALAAAVGLVRTRPLQARPAGPVDKVVVFVPHPHADAVVDAMAAAGAGSIGDYEHWAYRLDGTGQFRPLPGADPSVGRVGALERVAEARIEMVCPRDRRTAVVAALRSVHPYEEPAFDVIELADRPGTTGLGRVGDLPEPTRLMDLAERVAAALPSTAHGVRTAGDPERVVRSVAVCGGAGDSLLAVAARSGADAYLTADLRHHRAQDHLADGGCALLDVAHWASEWPWLPAAAALLEADLGPSGTTVETRVSTLCTDPWTLHLRSPH